MSPIRETGGSGSVANATSGTTGVVQLAGDLGGSATSPIVPRVSGVSGPGGTAGANTGASVTVGNPTSATGFGFWWGVLTANVTITMPSPVAGARFVMRLDQDATGGRTVTFAGSPAVEFPGVSLSVLSAANAENWISFESDGVKWQAFPVTGPAVSGGGVAWSYAEVLTSETTDTSGAYKDLTTVGPALTVTVPTHGLVQIFAQVDLTANTSGTAQVAIDDSGADFPGSFQQVMATSATAAETRYTVGGTSNTAGVTNKANASPWVFPSAAGSNTYTLKYRNGTAGQTATFANRKLWVAVITPS